MPGTNPQLGGRCQGPDDDRIPEATTRDSLLTSVFGALRYDYGLLGEPALAVIADP